MTSTSLPLPSAMRAVVITAPGGPEVLKVEQRPVPAFGPEEVLIRVKASALNRADILQRQGRYPAPPGVAPDIPGMEFAGEIAALGKEVADWKLGDRVMGIVAGASQAEYLATHHRLLCRIPDAMDWATAASVPEVYMTAQDALITQAGLRAGETLLIHAVGSGVGLAALQWARAVGAIPYGTSRTADKLVQAKSLGLEDGCLAGPSLDELKLNALKMSGGQGFDVVLDLVGGPYLAASLGMVATRGRILCLATTGGAKAELDMRQLLSKRAHIIGTVLRGRTLEEKIAVTKKFQDEGMPLLAAGKLAPVMDSVFALEEIQAAHRRMESNASFGKVVLKLD